MCDIVASSMLAFSVGFFYTFLDVDLCICDREIYGSCLVM